MGGAGERIGIKEVAAAAGVSITTVSHALNGKGRLPAETRERVRDVAEALGYVPSATARSLARGRTGILALTVARAATMPFSLADFDYFAQLMNGASTAALERGYALVLAPAAAGTELLDSVPLDGAIVVDPVRGDRRWRTCGGAACRWSRQAASRTAPTTPRGSTTTTSRARGRSSITSSRPGARGPRCSPPPPGSPTSTTR